MKRYTDQEKACDMFNRYYHQLEGNEAQTLVCDMKQAFLELPTADVVEVRHSSWKLIEFSFGDSATIICGNCGREKSIKEERRDFKSVLPRFCEECGSLMDGEIEIKKQI